MLSLSPRKALPKGQAPAEFWRTCRQSIIDVLYRDFQHRFSNGRLFIPSAWHKAYLALLPKPQKPPTTPRNLRPISLLPAEAKIIARIAAQRLSPYLDQALQSSPQLAYAQGRQTYNALDFRQGQCPLQSHQATGCRLPAAAVRASVPPQIPDPRRYADVCGSFESL